MLNFPPEASLLDLVGSHTSSGTCWTIPAWIPTCTLYDLYPLSQHTPGLILPFSAPLSPCEHWIHSLLPVMEKIWPKTSCIWTEELGLFLSPVRMLFEFYSFQVEAVPYLIITNPSHHNSMTGSLGHWKHLPSGEFSSCTAEYWSVPSLLTSSSINKEDREKFRLISMKGCSRFYYYCFEKLFPKKPLPQFVEYHLLGEMAASLAA